MKKIFTIILLFAGGMCHAQADSAAARLKKPDTAALRKPVHTDTMKKAQTDTLKNKPKAASVNDTLKQTVADSSNIKPPGSLGNGASVYKIKPPLRWDEDTLFARMLTFAMVKNDNAQPANQGQARVPEGKEELFYMLAGLVFFIGAVKLAYPKYFQDIFRMFIQTSQRQKQTPEQIVQGYVPGFLFNILFFMVGGMLITLYGIKINYTTGPVWLLTLYCAGILAGIYLLKYSFTALAGWIFNVKDATGTYTFIIFLINRVIGILLLPLLVFIAFYDGDINTVLFTIAVSLVFFLLVYRYALSLTVIRKNLKVSALHFFIYLCSVELMPLLVIYKVLFNQFHSK